MWIRRGQNKFISFLSEYQLRKLVVFFHIFMEHVCRADICFGDWIGCVECARTSDSFLSKSIQSNRVTWISVGFNVRHRVCGVFLNSFFHNTTSDHDRYWRTNNTYLFCLIILNHQNWKNSNFLLIMNLDIKNLIQILLFLARIQGCWVCRLLNHHPWNKNLFFSTNLTIC